MHGFMGGVLRGVLGLRRGGFNKGFFVALPGGGGNAFQQQPYFKTTHMCLFSFPTPLS